MTAPRIPGPARVTWASESERLEGTITHALLVVPEGPDHHRLYFVAQDKTQLAQLCATVLAFAADNGVAHAALRIAFADEGASFRVPAADQARDPAIRERTVGGNCPQCSCEVPVRGRDATFSVCRHCGGRYV